MIAATKKNWLVSTNGLSGSTPFIATDPDEAMMYTYRLERYLRAIQRNPNISNEKAMAIAKDDYTAPLPDLRIQSCVEITEEQAREWEEKSKSDRGQNLYNEEEEYGEENPFDN